MTIPFKLTTEDAPHLTTLRRVSKEQHDLLLAENSGYANLAAQFNVPVGTIKSRFNRARNRIIKLRKEAEYAKEAQSPQIEPTRTEG